ncbi:hypothetical protein OAS39_07440 [Pirellulales bacterium]|nr:hypothetical protein [Pirellulales bacterium]
MDDRVERRLWVTPSRPWLDVADLGSYYRRGDAGRKRKSGKREKTS